MKQEKWRLKTYVPGPVAALSENLGISKIMAQVLVSRGLSTEAQAGKFLRSALSDMADPFLMTGMRTAAERLLSAVAAQEEIAVWGDYDADGITATSLLVRVLRNLGAHVRYHLPSRFTDGYGLNCDGIAELAQAGVALLVTVDSGIVSTEEVKLASQLGLDVIITDHHEPQEQLPSALAVLNPKLGSYPFRGLAGVGVAFKLCQALCSLAGGEGIFIPREAKDCCHEYLDLVALGTVADVVPLLDENRIIVKAGLELLEDSRNAGLAAMVEGAGLKGKPLSAYHLGFILGPRLNAVGRLGDAQQAVELLLTDDPVQAKTLAGKLEELNRQRQELCAKLTEEVQKAIADQGQEDAPVIVMGGEGWHPGIIGIVASRITESYQRPAILISWEGDEGRGSGRSLPGFDLFAALTRCREHLIRYGGHAQAAGLTLRRDKLGQLREALAALTDEAGFQGQGPVLELGAELPPSQLTFELLGELELLGPYGEDNPEPLFLASGLSVRNWNWVGNGARHLSLALEDHLGKTMKAIGFGMGDLAARMEKYLQSSQRIDLAYRPRLEQWRGARSISMQMHALRLHRGPVRREEAQQVISYLEHDGYTILDARGVTAKGEYISALLADGARPFVYCPSFEAAETIRSQVEERFQNRILLLKDPASLQKLAGGEWSLAVWPLPLWTEPLQGQIRFLEHLIFYLPPLRAESLPELSALGEPAFIHLLFNGQDLETAEKSKQQIPDRQTLGKIYLLVRTLAKSNPSLAAATLPERLRRGAASVWNRRLSDVEVSLGLEVLSELKILEFRGSCFHFCQPAGKLDLASSPLYNLRQCESAEIRQLVEDWELKRIAKIVAQGRERAS